MGILVRLVKSSETTTLNGSWSQGNCSGSVTYDVQLFKDNVLYINFNTTSTGYGFSSLPSGSYYLTIVAYSFGELCDTGTSRSVIMGNYCIPIDAINISFSKLASFYGLTVTDIKLSGVNNPSTSESIFGRSNLPNTGINSKSRPNSISELRGTCGGVRPWDSSPYSVRFSSSFGSITVQTLSSRIGAIKLIQNSTDLTPSLFLGSQDCVLYSKERPVVYGSGIVRVWIILSETSYQNVGGSFISVEIIRDDDVVIASQSYSHLGGSAFEAEIFFTPDLNRDYRIYGVFNEDNCIIV
jgi:thiol-disulfide isomerase/thioredoxin